MKLFDNPLELVILDVDGVILDLLACFEKNLVMAAKRLDLPTEPIKQYLLAVSAGGKNGYTSLQEAVPKFWPNLNSDAVSKYIEIFRFEEKRNPYPPIAGSIEMIRWLNEHDIPVALCTTNDSETLDFRLKVVGIDLDLFKCASTLESEFPKPDARALDPIFKTVPVPRENAVYVGDWYSDLETARGAGVRFIAVLSGGIPRHAFLRDGVAEDHILNNLAELKRLIARG